MGRLTNDPETRFGQGTQKTVTRFSVAVNRGKKKDGTDLGADFPPCVCFDRLAENVERYCRKGQLVAVEGKVMTGSYEKNGRKVYTTEILCEKVDFLERLDAERMEKSNKARQDRKDAAAVNAEIDSMLSDEIPEGFSKMEEDIPF